MEQREGGSSKTNWISLKWWVNGVGKRDLLATWIDCSHLMSFSRIKGSLQHQKYLNRRCI